MKNRFHLAAAMGASVIACGVAAPAFAQSEKPEQDTIVVTAQNRNRTQIEHNASLGALGNQDAMNTPFAVKSYSDMLILNQQPLSLGQVLENDPSVRTSLGSGNASETFIIRGFPLYGEDIAIDGLFGITPRQLISPELYDQVQILNGASAFLFGAAPGGTALGGTVNLEPKRATAEAITRVTANYLSKGHWGGAFDMGRRFGSGGQFGIRINGAGRWGEVSVDSEYRSSETLGIGMDFHSGRFKASFDLAYQHMRVEHMRPMVALSGVTFIPAAPSASMNYGQAWNYTTLRDIFGIAKAEYAITDHVSVYAEAGARQSHEFGRYQTLTLLNASTGAARSTGSVIPRYDNNEAEQAGIRGKVSTGPVTHQFNLGGSLIHQVNRNAYRFAPSTGTPNNLYSFIQVPEFAYTGSAGGNMDDPNPVSRTRMASLFGSDTLGLFDDRLLLTGGLRRQSLAIRSYAYATGLQSASYSKSATTPVVGLVFRPVKAFSLYANRIEALLQGPTAPSTAINVGEIFPPYQAVQYEVGAKVEVGRFHAGAALYQTDKPQAFLAVNSLNQSVYTLDGLQRNKGMEFSLDGEVVKGLRLIAGFSVTDAKQLRTTNGTYDGKSAIGVPTYTANANLEWDLAFLKGVTLTGRIMQTGKQYADQANALALPEWTRLDMGARYVAAVRDVPVTFRFNVDNLANNAYWASSLSGYLVQGRPRTYKASVTANF